MKHRAWLLPLLLLVALGAAGCAKSRSPEPTAPPQQAQKESPAGQQPAQSKPEGAPAGSPEAEIARWKATVAREPTADNWNELSYANIKAEQWEAAVQAGQAALKLKQDHPYALFNTGLALVKWGKPMEALSYLKKSAALQPDRHEPQLLLAQAYQQLGHHLLAHYYARQAVNLAKDDPEAVRTEREVAGMLAVKPPADLAAACAAQFSDGGFSLCLREEPSPGKTAGDPNIRRRYTLWYGSAGAIPVGYTQPGKFVKTTLPGGGTGYWLSGGQVGALVADTVEWRLFVREGNGLRQILFLGGDDYEGGRVSDFMRSVGPPAISGEQIVTSHKDDVTGTRTMRTTRHLSLAEGTVTVVGEETIIPGTLTQLSPKVEVQSDYNSYKWAYPLAGDARILLNGQQAKLADLKVGMFARITVKDGMITELGAQK